MFNRENLDDDVGVYVWRGEGVRNKDAGLLVSQAEGLYYRWPLVVVGLHASWVRVSYSLGPRIRDTCQNQDVFMVKGLPGPASEPECPTRSCSSCSAAAKCVGSLVSGFNVLVPFSARGTEASETPETDSPRPLKVYGDAVLMPGTSCAEFPVPFGEVKASVSRCCIGQILVCLGRRFVRKIFSAPADKAILSERTSEP